MGVYIKGMKMPKNCNDCWALDDNGDYPRCIITEEQRGYTFKTREQRMSKCPLEPHGRLIDADRLCAVLNEKKIPVDSRVNYEIVNAPTVSATKKLNNQIHLCDSCKYNYPNCPSENEDVLFGNGVDNDNICCCAKYFVSIDRPHGEWIKHEIKDTCRWIECSECHKEYPNIEMNFCPNCGKRMEGGDTE